jgi:hypothetical protein
MGREPEDAGKSLSSCASLIPVQVEVGGGEERKEGREGTRKGKVYVLQLSNSFCTVFEESLSQNCLALL